MNRYLIRMYDYFELKRLLLFLITVVLFGCLLLGASMIRLEEDIARMLPQHSNTKNLNTILASSSLSDKIVVKIKSKQESTEDLGAIADEITELLSKDYQPYIKTIKTKVDDAQFMQVYEIILRNLPLYLEKSDYSRIDTLISQRNIKPALEAAYMNMLSPSGFATRRIVQDDPLGIAAIALKKMERLQANNTFELENGYFTGDGGHSVFIFITPANPTNETAKNTILVEGLSNITHAAEKQHKGVNIFFYGGTAVAVSNAAQMKRDTVITLSITLVGIISLVMFFFRRKRLPLVMISPVIFGAIFALAIIALLQGSISSIAVAAGSIVMGIAVNYSIHFLSHYKHTQDVRVTISELFEPTTIGSFTTIASFFSLTLLESKILTDFGLFAALSLLGAAIFSLTFLPHFIPKPKGQSSEEPALGKLIIVSEKWRNRAAVAILLLTIFMLPNVGRVSFESDMNRLSFLNPELKVAEKEIGWLQNDTTKTVFITSTAPDFEQALEYNEQFLQKLKSPDISPLVTAVAGPGVLLQSTGQQDRRIAVWNKYWQGKREPLMKKLNEEAEKAGFRASAFESFGTLIGKNYTRINDDDKQYLTNNLLSDYCVKAPGMEGVINAVTVEKESRKELYAKLADMPFVTVLDKQVITNFFIENIYQDFSSILLYTSLIVFFALLVSYGRIELTIISFVPMIIAWIWILSFMQLFGIQFNIINIIISTFIFGIGDDFSIFTTDGLLQRFKYNKSVISSHRVSILLCAATTILGLGALIFARHPALRSIALVSIIGICCVVFIGQTVQPFLFNFFVQSRRDKGLAPWTIPTLLLAIFAFSYFVFGSLLLTLLGFVVFYILPYPARAKRKYAFHIVLSRFAGSLVYIMMNVRKVHINKENVDFSKPAVIIANHVSFLDILVIVMQHPRLILLTNKWVYHSPVFGKVVQMADYYPVMEGIEPAIDRFESIVEQGYSIVVFPEGTRSVDGKIHRFHKGSFYLAEKLGLDIIPLLLHGTGDTMGKGDFMLFNGTMTMKFLPRIAAGDNTYGANYAEKTKLISAHFKQVYLELKKELETAKYFRQRLIANYNYKGPVLEWKSRMVTREYAVFDTIHKWLPEKGNIVEIGCGYGFYTYMLHFLASTRTWTAIDKDEEKVSLAANCFSKKSNVTFIQGDAGCMDLEPSESILLHDIFRHSTPEDAKVVLHKVLQALLPGGLLIFRFAKVDIDTRKASLKLLPEGFEMTDEQQFDKTVLIKVKCN